MNKNRDLTGTFYHCRLCGELKMYGTGAIFDSKCCLENNDEVVRQNACWLIVLTLE